MTIERAVTREQKKRQTHQAFFDSVLNLCMKGQGFSSISLRQVTREVGVVPTAFYRHFRDMEELGKSLVEDELGNALKSLREHMQLGKQRSFERQIATSVQLFFTAVDASPRYWQFIASERFGGSKAVRRAIAEQIHTFSTIMAEDLVLQPAFSHINGEDRYLLAEVGVNMSFSWIVDWLDLTHTADSDNHADNRHNGTANRERESKKRDLLHRYTRQMQMLFYGAYNWKSSEETLLNEFSYKD